MDMMTSVGQHLLFAFALALAFALGWWLRHVWSSAEVQPSPAPLRQANLVELEEALGGAQAALARLRFESEFQRMAVDRG